MRKTVLWALPALALTAFAANAAPVSAPKTPAEKAALRARVDNEVASQFKRADSNRDGLISRAEFNAKGAKTAGYFDIADLNKDGSISRDELNVVVSTLFEQWVARQG